MFSVVIPLYNKEASVRNAIQSVLQQTIPDFELLIINDGSTDKSRSVAASIQDHRIRIIDQCNRGVSNARNKGILSAKYNYIAFIDADDQWETDFLETIKDLITEYPDAGGYGTAYICKFNNIISNVFSVNERGIVKDFFKQAYNGPILHASSVCIKKETFNTVGYFNEQITRGEDYDMWARLARKSSIAATPDPKVWYRLDAENRAMSSLPAPPSIWLYHLRNEDITDPIQKKYYRRFLHRQVFTYIMKGKYGWAWQMASKNRALASWYSYFDIPSYIQLRQIKTLWSLLNVWLDKRKSPK